MWLLSPIALQILHYLDDADDAHAFLAAAPNDSLDDALDALRTLLAMKMELPLWPTPHIARLDEAYNVSPSVVTKALSVFKEIDMGFGKAYWRICQTTVLPPTTAVTADILNDIVDVRAALGNWFPNLANLRVISQHGLDFASATKDYLSACRGLRTLTIQSTESRGQDAFDAALMAVVASCPQVESVCVGATQLSYMSDCETLLAWLALPTARHLALDATDFQGDLGAELAKALLTSTTLETIHLSGVPSLTRAFLCSSSPPLLRQLRHLVLWDYILEIYDSYDDDNDTVIPARAFDEADMVALAAKLATTSRLESLDVWLRVACNITPVLSVLLEVPTLVKFTLRTAHLTSFPPLMQLLHLDLSSSTFSDAAIASLATLLCSSPKLVHLDLGDDELPSSQIQTLLRALPQWLSHRGTACDVRLALTSDACASAFATALAQTRNSHKVKLTIYANDLSLDAKKQLVAALGATSRMAMVLFRTQRAEVAVLEAYGTQHQVTTVHRKESPNETTRCWFFSPRSTTN